MSTISALGLAISCLLSLGHGRYARHIEDHALPVAHRTTQLAEHAEHGETVSGVSRYWLVAHWCYEATLDHGAENDRTKAFGIGQLHPLSRWYRGYLKDCALSPFACEAKSAEWSAIAMRDYRRQCGTMLKAVSAYKIGHCVEPGPQAYLTQKLAMQLAWRVKHPSTARIYAARLP